MRAYSAAETIFPAWEAAYAIVSGQLLIAYLSNRGSLLLPIFGLVLSISWLIMVSLNLQYANILDTKIRNCEKSLQEAYDNRHKTQEDLDSIKKLAFPGSEDRPEFWNIVLGHKKDEEFLRDALPKLLTSSWFYRRLLPLVLVLIWISLLPSG